MKYKNKKSISRLKNPHFGDFFMDIVPVALTHFEHHYSQIQ